MKPVAPAEATDPTTIPDRLVDSTDELTPEWLTATLRANAVISEHTTVATAQSAVVGTGQLG
ncbi:MAG: hypothetical protein QOG76_8440, partial [Pseudonocardiales bacterium]|nr:hypothetical protein [Pseudonocardiales bacterium]